jgi:hypothetical protein
MSLVDSELDFVQIYYCKPVVGLEDNLGALVRLAIFHYKSDHMVVVVMRYLSQSATLAALAMLVVADREMPDDRFFSE